MSSTRSTILGLLFVSFSSVSLTGQDTILAIPVVEVNEDRLQNAPGQTIQLPDSLEMLFLHSASLQDQLQLNPANHVRSYGPGRLATMSARGSGSGQHTVSFDGLNLLNPLWGLVDYSQVPLFFFSTTGQHSGNQTSRIGSGSAAGQSTLGTGLSAIQRSGLEAQLEMGSFQTLKTGIGAHYSWKERSKVLLRVMRDQAENNYPFLDRFGDRKSLSHARFSQQGILLDATTQLSSKHEIGLTAWALKGYRQIPPTLAQQNSEAQQEDESARILLRWQWRTKQWIGGIRTAYLTDGLHYTDPASGGLDNQTQSRQVEVQTWATNNLGRGQSILGELGHRIIRGSSDHYANLPDESRTYLHLRYSWTSHSTPLKIWLSHRSEQAAGEIAWSIPSIGIEYQFKPFIFRGHLSRHVRWAAWDDRYWVPGGNPDIQPEKGWTSEAGFTWTPFKLSGDLLLSVNGYFRQVNDWIQWTPQPGYWSPENLFNVRSQGVESTLSWSLTSWLRYSCRYALTQSLRRDRDEMQTTNDRQLPYIPLHSVRQYLYLQQWGFTFRIRHQWTDAVSTLADGSEGLPAFHLLHLDLARTMLWGRQDYLLWIRCENVLDHTYYLVRNLPLPGRQFSVGIRWTMD